MTKVWSAEAKPSQEAEFFDNHSSLRRAFHKNNQNHALRGDGSDHYDVHSSHLDATSLKTKVLKSKNIANNGCNVNLLTKLVSQIPITIGTGIFLFRGNESILT